MCWHRMGHAALTDSSELRELRHHTGHLTVSVDQGSSRHSGSYSAPGLGRRWIKDSRVSLSSKSSFKCDRPEFSGQVTKASLSFQRMPEGSSSVVSWKKHGTVSLPKQIQINKRRKHQHREARTAPERIMTECSTILVLVKPS